MDRNTYLLVILEAIFDAVVNRNGDRDEIRLYPEELSNSDISTICSTYVGFSNVGTQMSAKALQLFRVAPEFVKAFIIAILEDPDFASVSMKIEPEHIIVGRVFDDVTKAYARAARTDVIKITFNFNNKTIDLTDNESEHVISCI